MNERKPYEQRLAEKLDQLSLPDSESSWQRMKALLDRELPPSGGDGGDDGRMPGGKWWSFGVAIGVILLAGWFGARQGWFGNKDKSSLAKTEIKNNSKPESRSLSPAFEKAGPDEETKRRNGSINNQNSNNTQSDSNDRNLLNRPGDIKDREDESRHSSLTPQPGEDNRKESSSASSKPDDKAAHKPGANQAESVTGSVDNTIESSKSTTPGKHSKALASGAAAIKESKNAKAGTKTRPKTNNSRLEYSGQNLVKEEANGKDKYGNKGKALNKNSRSIASGKKGNKSGGNLAPSKHPSPGAQSIILSKDDQDNATNRNLKEESSLLAEHLANKKGIRASAGSIADMPREKTKEEIERAKWQSMHEAIGFVFGLSVYQNFAISSNLSYYYNSAANKGILLDYLPSVYGQYHINNKMYVQAELQFNAPQATPNLLLSSSRYDQMVAGNTYEVERNVYLRKLYYFNIPVNFYYSPARNFYLGSGLQFSSMNSGLASIEEQFTPIQPSAGYPYSSSNVVSFKKDTLSAKLSKTEFRFMLDVNYNYRWFTAGLRLNQALKDYVNLNFHNTSPSQDKNESLQLYLRFNVWDGRHRGMPMPNRH